MRAASLVPSPRVIHSFSVTANVLWLIGFFREIAARRRTAMRHRAGLFPGLRASVWLCFEPDPACDLAVGDVVADIVHEALHAGGGGIHEIVEDRQDQPALVTHDKRYLAIERAAVVIVQFRARLIDELVEIGTLEPCVVPLGVGDIGRRIARILRRTAAPVGGAERLYIPDFGPVAVARQAVELYRDTGLGGMLLEQLCRIDRAGEGRFGGAQPDRLVMARLLVVEGSLLRIVNALLDV